MEACRCYLPGVFVATLPGAPAHGAFDQLLADSKRQIRARYPNGDPEGVSGLCFTKGQCADQHKQIIRTQTYAFIHLVQLVARALQLASCGAMLEGRKTDARRS